MEGVEEFNYESHIGLVEIYYTAFVKRRMEKQTLCSVQNM